VAVSAAMTTDLTMLTWTAVLCALMSFTYISGLLTITGGFSWGLGNRNQPLANEKEWARRARRAHANLVENLIPFAALVLVAHATGKANAMTALGAEIFFWARLVYTVTYIAGLVPWRTFVFIVGQTGLFLVALQLLR